VQGEGFVVSLAGFAQLVPGVRVEGPLLPEPVEILAVIPMGDSIKLVAMGLRTKQVHQPVLDAAQVAQLIVTPKDEPFDGDAARFRLGIEAQRLGLAYEYDPYFSLSIARVDPLPHQLEAVYEYFLKLPRIRFLLADDPGAGKTIMAGLLLKELKVRGLVQRVLIVTPANLTFQWQREMKEKFREGFHVVKGDILRAGYGSNPWTEHDQVVTSVSWISRIDDAKDSLLRAHWDLVIVDEAHKMSPTSAEKPTLAFQIGEALSDRTDHFLLMTATPHKGDPDHFRRFLTLLDRDVYADVASLKEAMKRKSAPFYLRRVKEALVSFPDPETGKVKRLFTARDVQTSAFELDGDEFSFYDALTQYVLDQSAKAAADESPAARALGFTMAMLQRRFASSMYAVRRSLERMRDRRQKILEDPDKYRKQQVAKQLPDDFDELPEDEQQRLLSEAEDVVVSFDPAQLREEIRELGGLIDEARGLETREVESKLNKLREILQKWGIFGDPKTKLLIFTEHKDTLDYLAGDGKDHRPRGKLLEWGLKVTQIHGGMKIGDRDTPGTRIYAEREFRETAQILVATEAAGEGINLQFCWMMINYDIPWNPVRLEQRMGRIHRYGQEHDCLIFNFAATNTVEGRVLAKLLERLRQIRVDLESDKVFDVVGDVFPSNLLEKMFRDLYAGKIAEKDIQERVGVELDPKRFREITEATLEGLAKRELNLSAIIGKSAEAKERRLVPEVIEDFAVAAGPVVGLPIKPEKQGAHVYRFGKIPKHLLTRGHTLEPRFGAIAREYGRVAFNKELLKADATLEWVTPGHPLFESLRSEVEERVAGDLRRGAVFYDLQSPTPYRLDVFGASIKDGRGHVLHRRLFVVRVGEDFVPAPMRHGQLTLDVVPPVQGALPLAREKRVTLTVKQPTLFLDLIPAPAGTRPPEGSRLPDGVEVERVLLDDALKVWLEATKLERAKEIQVVRDHVEISLNELINRAQVSCGDMQERLSASSEPMPGIQGLIAQAEQHVEDLNHRLENRLAQLDMERLCTIADIDFLGRAWALPHPDRAQPAVAPMVRDEEIEKRAVEEATRYEEARGWVVESVESENRGFDLISRLPHPHDSKTFTQVRFIEVKGRAGVGEVGLSSNEFKTAQRLAVDYWLYVVFNCAGKAELHPIQNPATLGWKPVVRVEQFLATPAAILAGVSRDERALGAEGGS
jgi:superfamily II DNA or RNA helicase